MFDAIVHDEKTNYVRRRIASLHLAVADLHNLGPTCAVA